MVQINGEGGEGAIVSQTDSKAAGDNHTHLTTYPRSNFGARATIPVINRRIRHTSIRQRAAAHKAGAEPVGGGGGVSVTRGEAGGKNGEEGMGAYRRMVSEYKVMN